MGKNTSEDLGFSFQDTKSEYIRISHHHKVITILRGNKARNFTEKIKALNFGNQQQFMARITGNFKRGNERSP